MASKQERRAPATSAPGPASTSHKRAPAPTLGGPGGSPATSPHVPSQRRVPASNGDPAT